MSRELIFYPMYEKDGILTPALKNKKGDPKSVYWRSGSFMRYEDEVTELPELTPEDFAESCRDYFASDLDTEHTYCYKITESMLAKGSETKGLKTGYLPIKELLIYNSIEDEDEKYEYLHWDLPALIDPAVIAEMPESKRKKYGHFSYIDDYSLDYTCNILSEIMWGIEDYQNEGKLVMIALYSF